MLKEGSKCFGIVDSFKLMYFMGFESLLVDFFWERLENILLIMVLRRIFSKDRVVEKFFNGCFED